jgi:hypothetical protein
MDTPRPYERVEKVISLIEIQKDKSCTAHKAKLPPLFIRAAN